MHRALYIPEVLQLVLSSDVSRVTLRDAALTCSLWQDAALDQLWKDLDSVLPIIWVLVPIFARRRESYEKTTRWTADDGVFPTAGGWIRLEKYARRVRTLVFDVYPQTGDRIPLNLLQTIAQFRPSGKYLLPNLRQFTYNARELGSVHALLPFFIFLGPSITDLKLLEIDPMVEGRFLEYIAQRVPHVQHLLIEGSRYPYREGSSALASSLIQLEKLKSFDAPHIALIPAVWDAMAQHPSLVSAGLWLLPPSFHAPGFQPRVFAKLESLAFRANFSTLCQLFESQNDLPTITRVAVLARSAKHGGKDLHRLCELLVQKLPMLAHVELASPSSESRDDVPLGFEDFRPLVQCKKLQHFVLEHAWGVSVTINQLEALLDAWPGIETFALQYAVSEKHPGMGVSRAEWKPPTLPLSVLDNIAAKAPKIKQLRLVLDATTPINSTSSICERQFECLEELDVTLSTVAQPAKVASYLARRCKKRFSLKFFLSRHLSREAAGIMDGEKTKWDQVEDHLKLLFDQKEILEEEFKRKLEEERAKYMRE
ncbi:hypothetical protein FS837_006432 [Tulasnella sp. UAMH 9824]|nr:hypothetical protein FS837_006432 [Tulasnella sp. UAMH 9824]